MKQQFFVAIFFQKKQIYFEQKKTFDIFQIPVLQNFAAFFSAVQH